MLDHVLVPINRAAWPFVLGFFAVSVILGFLWLPLFWVGLVATAWCVYFFRDPPRMVPTREGLVISPADGRVQYVGLAAPPAELGLTSERSIRISVFLDVFDVHVNRIPIGGRVGSVNYRPGKFLNAALDKASEENERTVVRIETDEGRSYGVVQIAGLVARRIVCELQPGQTVRAGERFGLIRFGSRVDVYLPDDAAPLVMVGQRAVAGETVFADLKSDEPQRRGEER